MKGKVKPDGMGGYTPIDIENWKKIGSENQPGNNNGKPGSSSSSSGSDSGEKPSITITETEETDAFGRKTKKTQIQQKVTPTQYDSIQQKKAEELTKLLEGIKTN
jgi:hypothetical protein